uniref:Bm13634 n=1 Tax=Brugia malayi TaxID=6279 RepID=A0A1I9G604_BRUMA|nr:Bm13634 [Brugia malayi]
MKICIITRVPSVRDSNRLTSLWKQQIIEMKVIYILNNLAHFFLLPLWRRKSAVLSSNS